MKKKWFAMVALLVVCCTMFPAAMACTDSGCRPYSSGYAGTSAYAEFVHITHYQRVNVRSGPSTGYRVLCEVRPDEWYPYLGTAYGWHCIELNDGRIGYVSNTLTTLDGAEWAIIP